MIDFTTITNLYLANNEVEELYINGSKVWEKSHEPTIPDGLRFTARDGGETVQLFKNGNAPSCSFQYSTDGERTWNDLTLGTTFTLANAGDSISFRAKNAQPTLAYNWDRNHKFQLGSTGHISVDGSFYALLRQDWKTAPKSGWMGQRSFRALFSDVRGEFDITNVQPLDWAPTYDCYGGMFFYTNINGAIPSGLLPSTSVAQYCYQAMFEASSITNAPDLPATSLQQYCYAYMFKNCGQLAVAPTISATRAQAGHCCESMFMNNVALTTGPAILANLFSNQACFYMFSGCTSLRTINMARVDQVGTEGMAQMFYGCTSLTSFPDVLSNASVGANGFSRMFQGCTSLTQIPTLPTGLGNLSCEHMFEGCTGLTGTIDLTQYTSIQGSGSGYGAFDYAFVGCTGITKVDLSNLLSAHGIYHEFDGCTSLVELDLSKLEMIRSDSQAAFENMCNGCTSLTTVRLDKLTSMGSFTAQWHNTFNGCSSLEVIHMEYATAVPYFYDNATFSGASADYKIVVPDSLYNDWIVASGWSDIASHIVSASDYQAA